MAEHTIVLNPDFAVNDTDINNGFGFKLTMRWFVTGVNPLGEFKIQN